MQLDYYFVNLMLDCIFFAIGKSCSFPLIIRNFILPNLMSDSIWYPKTLDVLQQVFSRHGYVENNITYQMSSGKILISLSLSLSLYIYIYIYIYINISSYLSLVNFIVYSLLKSFTHNTNE